MIKPTCLVLMGAVLAGCSGSGFEGPPEDVCKKQHIKETSEGDVAVCDELYDAAPYVHLPKDEAGHAFAGIELTQFTTASGKVHGVPDLDAETNRRALFLYELVLDGNAVTEYRPVVEFSDAVFVKPFLGRAAEGTISRRTGAERFAEETSLPVRLEFAAKPAGTSLSGRAESTTRIANLHEAVTASDGSCLPALTSYGDEATFPAETDVELRGYRTPSMHGVGDDEYVLLFVVNGEAQGTLMAPTWYRGPIDLARGVLAPSGRYTGVGHGTPGYTPELDLDFVAGGGAPCTPSS